MGFTQLWRHGIYTGLTQSLDEEEGLRNWAQKLKITLEAWKRFFFL